MTPANAAVLQGDDGAHAAEDAVHVVDPAVPMAGGAAGVNVVGMSGAEVLSSAYFLLKQHPLTINSDCRSF